LKLQTELESTFKQEPKHRHQAARTYNSYATWLIQDNRRDEAAKQLEQAAARLKLLNSQDPANSAYQAELAGVYINQGYLLEGKAQEESIRSYQTAIDLLLALDQFAPTNWENQSRLALAHNNMGQLLNRAANKEALKTRGLVGASGFGLTNPLVAPGP